MIATAALPLSQSAEAAGLVFLSGQLAIRDGALVEGDVAAQTEVVIDRIAALLEDLGLSLADVVRCGVWLTDASDVGAFNAVYARRFARPYPVRATVVSALVVPGARIEIDAVASRAGATFRG